MSKRFRAGILGVGPQSELHVAAVKALADVELVGVSDDLDSLVTAGANVIHVVTAPATHGKLAKAALEKGCHVLIEKPATQDEKEALEIGRLAQRKGLMATVSHALLFDPQIERAIEAVRSGALGNVVSVDLLRGLDYPPYEGGPMPPWYRDAGYAVRDVGVECLYLLQELLGPIEDIDASWRSVGGDPNLAFDEWRAVVRCKRGLGQFQLTNNTRPVQSQLILNGTTGSLRVDLGPQSPARRSPVPLPRAAERLLSALGLGKKEAALPAQGLHELVAELYRRLEAGSEPPVTVEDAARIIRWVEKVARAAEAEHAARLATFPRSESVPFLVTGASGNLGRATVQRLREQGHRVRVLVRRMPERPEDGIEYCFGDLGDPQAVERAVQGAETVIHAGAAMKGGWPEHKVGTIDGTRNVIAACKQHGVKQLVYISSMSVIDWAGSSQNGHVDESANLEPRSDERGAYTRAKLEAEKLVADAARQGLPCVILRPGQIFGGGIPLINGAVARHAAGRWLVLGDGKLRLPLVYIDDVVDAITSAIDKKLTGGEIIQIIDPETLTQEDVLGLAGGDRPVMRVPRPVVFALGKLSEIPLAAIGKPSPIGVYRLRSALARLQYQSNRANVLLGWRPRVGVREGIRRIRQTPM